VQDLLVQISPDDANARAAGTARVDANALTVSRAPEALDLPLVDLEKPPAKPTPGHTMSN